MMIVIAAGGTGGHLYPAVALARAFLHRDSLAEVLFVGTMRGLESRVLTHEGFNLALINARPIMGKGLWEGLLGLWVLPLCLWQCVRILRTRQTDLVIGVGGYTSPMMIFAAALMRVPRVIFEPNANSGMANKAVGFVAQRIFLAFESAASSFNRVKVRVVGTPIRRAFLDCKFEMKRQSELFHLLILGGSQGAKAINTAVLEGLDELTTQLPSLRVTHQTGQFDYARVVETYRGKGLTAQVIPFIYDMPAALWQADLVVARAGAMTVAELTTCGKPAILIPLSSAIYDHQRLNAKVMEAAGAAVVVSQSTFTGSSFVQIVTSLFGDPERMRAMGKASQAMRCIDATEIIVRECYKLMVSQHGANPFVDQARS